MAYDFQAKGREATGYSPVKVGRTKGKISDILGEDVTIVAFDLCEGRDRDTNEPTDVEYGVIALNEYPDRWFSLGKIGTEVVMSWTNDFKGDIQEASNALAESGGVKVRFNTTVSPVTGNNYTMMDFI